MGDRALGGACLALAGFFAWQASRIEIGFISDPLGPKAFPMVIAGVLGIAGIIPMLRPDPRPQWPARSRLLEIVLAAGLMVAYAMLLPVVGFVVSTAVAAAVLCWRLGAGAAPAMVAGAAISAGIYGIFYLVLGLSLARGPWGF